MNSTSTDFLMWTLEDAIALCRKVEEFAPKYGCHIGLTGGCLYKDGLRKDIDIVVYRIRQVKEIDWRAFLHNLCQSGFIIIGEYGFVIKAEYKGKSVDILFPEYEGGEYFN